MAARPPERRARQEHEHHHVLIEPEEDRWAWRRRIRQNPRRLAVYRVAVAFAGSVMIALGCLTGPLPGPGGIPLVLLGLAIWASEFEWAHKVMQWFKGQLKRYKGWTPVQKVVFWLVFFLVCGSLGLPVPAGSGRAVLDALLRRGPAAAPARGLTRPEGPRRRVGRADNEAVRAADHPFFDAPFLAFAHRGGALHPANLGRENTRYAFEQAVALGYRYLETDVHATADGVLVAFHDDRLDRVTDRHGLITSLRYAELAEARIGGRDGIPTFAELLAAFPACRFNVDAKSDGAVDLLADAVAAHDAYDRVCVSSFGIRRLHRLRRRLGPRAASAASSLGVAAHRFVPWVTAVLDTPGAALQIPMEHRLLGRRVDLVTPALVRHVHRAGKQVHVWTVDDPATMARLIDLGVDGIFTDAPSELRDVLRSRGLWIEATP